MEPIVLLIIYCVTGAIAAAIANSKGRSAVGWFFIGFFLGIIGIIIAAVVSNKKEEARHRTHAQAERRRLREQLRQEKMKSESFRRHAAARLDAHDGALGLDTRTTPGLGSGAGQLRHPRMSSQARAEGQAHRGGQAAAANPRPVRPAVVQPGAGSPDAPRPGDDLKPPMAASPTAQAGPPVSDPSEVNWYYESDGESRGPIPQSTVLWMLESGALAAETLVWTEGQGDWVAASSTSAFGDATRS